MDAYLEETEPGALQRELAAMNQAEYREAGMLVEHFLAKGRAEGLEQGLEKGKLEAARKMREHGIDWKIVTDVTGMRPEDLEG